MARVSAPSQKGLSHLWDGARSSFGLLSTVGMVIALAAGLSMPALDAALDVEPPVFNFAQQSAARSTLETIATVTVAVAGISFSVTIVAFTLVASQLSPRVLRSFRRDSLSQWTLALFLGSFVYALAVLVRLGTLDGGRVPHLSVTLAIVLVLLAFGVFSVFIGHIVKMLQTSSVVASIASDAEDATRELFPAAGRQPDDPARAVLDLRTRQTVLDPRPVVLDESGYLNHVAVPRIVELARRDDAVVQQLVPLGDFVTPGMPVAEVWTAADGEKLAGELRHAFHLGQQRTTVQDVAFPIRQLADIALKGLSPGINDPTTAENAMQAVTGALVRFAGAEQPCPIRVDEDGRPRFVAAVPELDDLVRLAFDQVRVFAAPYPVVSAQLLDLLARIRRAAERAGLAHDEVGRQAALIAAGPDGEVPTAADVARVRDAYARHHGPTPA